MYIHVLRAPGSLTKEYPSWMEFLGKTADPLFRFHAKLFHQIGTAEGKIGSDIENAVPVRADLRCPAALYAIPNDPPVSGTFTGDGHEVTRYVNDADFFSSIPSRFEHIESISLDAAEPELFAVCYLDSPSGEFYALGHSGIYRYNLSGEILSQDVYNLDAVSDDLEFIGSRSELSYVPASGSLFIYDRYDLARQPIEDYVLSGKYVYMPYLSGTYVAEYDHLLYDDGVRLGTGTPLWDGYTDGGKIYMGTDFGAAASSVPFELDATPSHVYLIADPRCVRPGRNATVQFSYDVHTIAGLSDYHGDESFFPISGEVLLGESLRVYTTGNNGTVPLFFRDGNIYKQEVTDSTQIYLEDVETETSSTELRVLSGEYTSGTFYVSYFSQYTESYVVSGEPSYEATSFLQTPGYEDHYKIDEGILWPKTIFSVVETLAHIREQMSYAQRDRFSLSYPEVYGGICKRHTGNDIWAISQQLNAYQNQTAGSEFYVSTSPYEIDITYLFADALVDQEWARCYLLSGVYTLTDPGTGEEKYYRPYPVADLSCDQFQVIGFLGCGSYLLTVLYKDSTIDLLYHDPSSPQRVDEPDVIETSHALVDPKDSFLFDNRLYILDQNTLEVFQFFFDYRIAHGDMWFFRESYGTLEVTA